jgi:hypothetical protein
VTWIFACAIGLVAAGFLAKPEWMLLHTVGSMARLVFRVLPEDHPDRRLVEAQLTPGAFAKEQHFGLILARGIGAVLLIVDLCALLSVLSERR